VTDHRRREDGGGGTLTPHKGRLLLGEPKTKRSRRTVRLTELALEALKGHLTRQMEQMKRFSNLYEDQGLTFTTDSSFHRCCTRLR
jgi:integrase